MQKIRVQEQHEVRLKRYKREAEDIMKSLELSAYFQHVRCERAWAIVG